MGLKVVHEPPHDHKKERGPRKKVVKNGEEFLRTANL